MQIRAATPADVEEIMTVIAEARGIMQENGNNTQWSNGYPSRALIQDDIARQQAFVCVDGQAIAGYFCFVTGDAPDPNYLTIEGGKWLNERPYGVVHRLASGRKVKGIAQKAFDYAFSKTDNLRVDTHQDNVPMQNFLKKTGFSYCGIIYVGDGTPRDAFQKELSQAPP